MLHRAKQVAAKSALLPIADWILPPASIPPKNACSSRVPRPASRRNSHRRKQRPARSRRHKDQPVPCGHHGIRLCLPDLGPAEGGKEAEGGIQEASRAGIVPQMHALRAQMTHMPEPLSPMASKRRHGIIASTARHRSFWKSHRLHVIGRSQAHRSIGLPRHAIKIPRGHGFNIIKHDGT